MMTRQATTLNANLNANLTLEFNVPEQDPIKRLGLILWMARLSQGLELSQLGSLLNCTDEAVRLWEHGKRATSENLTDAFSLREMAKVLQQNPDLFLRVDPAISPRFSLPERDLYKRQGAILHMARIGQGKGREVLAAEIFVSRETVRNWERGKRAIDAVMLRPIAVAVRQDVQLFWS